jgi:hypothetical protein
MSSEFASRSRASSPPHIRKRTALTRVIRILRRNKRNWDNLFILVLHLILSLTFIYCYSQIAGAR